MKLRFFFSLIILSLLVTPGVRAENAVPSLYQPSLSFTDDLGKPFTLSALKGKKVLMTMVYTHCSSACPLMVEKLKDIEKKSLQQRAAPEIVLVSFDTDADTPATMAAFRKAHQLNSDRWHLLTSSPDGVRTLSVLLGISYERNPDTGDISHTSAIALLGPDGAIQNRFVGLDSDPDQIVKALE